MNRVIASLIVAIFFAAYVADSSVTPDKELTADLRETWDNDFVIAITNVKSRKKQSEATVDILLATKYDRSKKKMVLILDRRSKRVIFESIDKDGHRNAEHLNLETPDVNSQLKNIVVLVHQNQPDPRMDVYIDCVYQGMIPLRKSFRKLADNEDDTLVEAFRERRNQVKVYRLSSVIEALKQENCPDNLADMDSLSSFFKRKESHELIASTTTSSHPDKKNIEETDAGSKYRVKLENKENHHHHHRRSKEDEASSDVFEDADESDDFSDSRRSRSDHHSAERDRSNRDQYRSTNEFDADREVSSSRVMSRLRQRTPSDRRFAGSRREKSAEYTYHSNHDELDASSEANYKRVPRRGDIGIQSLDERVCLTDNQIAKTLNELIEATKKVWREIELNRLETQHLRQLIENCAACRVPLGGY